MSKQLQPSSSSKDVLNQAFRQDVQRIIPYLNKIMIDPAVVERFIAMSHLAVLRDPSLLSANSRSLLLAITWCAARDLEPGVDDGCWLIPFKGIVTPVPAYKGLIKRAIDSGSITRVKARPVYQGDTIAIRFGMDEYFEHIPCLDPTKRGKLNGAAVIFTYPDGSKDFHYMGRDDLRKSYEGFGWRAREDSNLRHTDS